MNDLVTIRVVESITASGSDARRTDASLDMLVESAVAFECRTTWHAGLFSVDALLRLYRFRADDARMADLPLADGRWDDDLFNPETLRQMGVRLGTGAAAGAAAGVGIDLMTGGLTPGAAAALGAIAGGLWQTFGHYGERLAAKLRGHRELTVDDAILRIVALRQRSLLVALDGRGHAAVKPIELDAGREGAAANADPVSARWRKDALPEAIGRARAHPEWAGADGSHKDEAIAELARALA